MPVAGPRTQARPLPGYANPGREQPHRLNHWLRPPPAIEVGRSPGTMRVSLRGHLLAPGTVRRVWRQTLGMIPAQAGYSWSMSAPAPDRPIISPRGLGLTSALRYMARSLYIRGGTDNTRFAGMHTVIQPHARSRPANRVAGVKRDRPTIRNRPTSFGRRVPPLNQSIPASE